MEFGVQRSPVYMKRMTMIKKSSGNIMRTRIERVKKAIKKVKTV